MSQEVKKANYMEASHMDYFNWLTFTTIYNKQYTHNKQLYIAQTGHTFKTRFKEHTRAIWFNQDNSKFTLHILSTTNSYGTTEETMEIIRTAKKKG
jgi:hypothetical protein